MAMVSLDVREVPRLPDRNFQVNDSHFIWPRILWQSTIERYLIPNAIRWSGLWSLLIGLIWFALLAFGVSENVFWENI